MSSMSIGQLAQQGGVAIDTVRYYERSGLLSPAGRLASGYRRYGPTELKRLRFIRRAKALGFSLEDIRELLALGEGCIDPAAAPSPGDGNEPAVGVSSARSSGLPARSSSSLSSRPSSSLSSRPQGEICLSGRRSLPAVEMTAKGPATEKDATTAKGAATEKGATTVQDAATAQDAATLQPAGRTTAQDDVAAVKRAAQRRLDDVEARIAELERIRDGLHTLVMACPGHGRADACPILNALAGEETP